MRYLQRECVLAIIFAITLLQSTSLALAQTEGSPVSGTPVAIEYQLNGRLGGSLDSVIERFGEPDFTGDEFVRYNSITLAGLPTILVVSIDSSATVIRLALVYDTEPALLADTIGIMALADTVSPEDGVCDVSSVTSGAGNQIYPCHSDALATALSAGRLTDSGITQSKPGDYSIAVDPLPDAYFELVIQPGDDSSPVASPVVADEPAPSPTPSRAQQYPPLTKPAALMNGDIALHASLSFSGEIMTLQIAEFGKQFRLGADESLGVSVLFQVKISAAGSLDPTVLFVGYNGDATNLAVGDTVTVYGTNFGLQCFDNALHKEICQPLIAADLVQEP